MSGPQGFKLIDCGIVRFPRPTLLDLAHGINVHAKHFRQPFLGKASAVPEVTKLSREFHCGGF